MSQRKHFDDHLLEQFDTFTKRKKVREDERTQRSRERNRVHAKNTRERKKNHLRQLQIRMQELLAEREKLKEMLVDTSVACILVSLSSPSSEEQRLSVAVKESRAQDLLEKLQNGDVSGFESVSDIQNRVAKQIEEEEEFDDFDVELLKKDKTSCNKNELELIRRERNRMHAKKTRLRKKRLLTETQATVQALENQVLSMRGQLINILPHQCRDNADTDMLGGQNFTDTGRRIPFLNELDDDSEYDSEDSSHNVDRNEEMLIIARARTETHGTRSDTSSEATSCARSASNQDSQDSTDWRVIRKRAVHELYDDPRRISLSQDSDTYTHTQTPETSTNHHDMQHMHSPNMGGSHVQFMPFPHTRPHPNSISPEHVHPHTYSQSHMHQIKPMVAHMDMGLRMRANIHPPLSHEQFVQMPTWVQHPHMQHNPSHPHNWMRAT